MSELSLKVSVAKSLADLFSDAVKEHNLSYGDVKEIMVYLNTEVCCWLGANKLETCKEINSSIYLLTDDRLNETKEGD